MSNNDITLPEAVTSAIEGIDCTSQHNNETIEGLAKAIERLTNDEVIKTLAKQICYMANETMNDINVAAEELGANYREVSHA